MIVRNSPPRLLNPGPVSLSPRVRNALLRPDLCHRQPEFSDLQQDVRRRLQRVYPEAAADYEPILLTGSGTAAVEAMVASLVPDTAHSLVVANGIYGGRIAEMLAAHGRPFTLLASPWGHPLRFEGVVHALRSIRRPARVITVHHETTTGRLNELQRLGAVCRRENVPLLLDAVSSFGAERLEFTNWNVEGCAATANKCLHGAPGISFVLARRETLERQRASAGSLYLDLRRHYTAQREGLTAFTPAVPAFYALREALREFEEGGGWQSRRADYLLRSRRLRDGLQAKGFERLLPDDALASSLTSWRLPPGLKFETLYDRLLGAGFVIYAGQQRLYQEIFRLAVMGELSLDDIAAVVDAFPSIAPTRPPAVAGEWEGTTVCDPSAVAGG